MVKKNRDFVLFGGNFAIKVLGQALLDLTKKNTKIYYINSSKKRPEIPEHVSTFFIAIPPNSNLKILELIPDNSKVFIEKPLSNSFEDAKKIKNLSIKKKLDIFVDFSFNFINTFERLSKLLVHEDVESYKFVWKTKTLQKNYKDNWKNDHRKGGGGLSNYISHIFSYLLINFGSIALIKSKLDHVHIDNFIFDDSSGKILLKHSNNILGNIEYDIFTGEDPAFIFEVKTKKYVYKISNNLCDFFVKFDLYRDDELIFTEKNISAKDARIPIVKKAIISFFENNKINRIGINHSVEVSQLIELIRSSSQKRKEIYVPKILI